VTVESIKSGDHTMFSLRYHRLLLSVLAVLIFLLFILDFVNSQQNRPYCLPLNVFNMSSDICNISSTQMVCSASAVIPYNLNKFSQQEYGYYTSNKWSNDYCPDHPSTAILFTSVSQYCTYGFCEVDADCVQYYFNLPMCYEYCLYCFASWGKSQAKANCQSSSVAPAGDNLCFEGDWSFSPFDYIADFWHAIVIVAFVIVALAAIILAVCIIVKRKKIYEVALRASSGGAINQEKFSEGNNNDLDLQADGINDDEEKNEEEEEGGSKSGAGDRSRDYDAAFGEGSETEQKTARGTLAEMMRRKKKDTGVRIEFSDTKDHHVDMDDGVKKKTGNDKGNVEYDTDDNL